MKIVVATIQTPFIRGGAEYHIAGLERALAEAGHAVERVSAPFRFNPLEQVRRSMRSWEDEDFTFLNGHDADRVICLQFPAYYLKHPRKVLWLLHQFRLVYDLWETPYSSGASGNPDAQELRREIIERDTQLLAEIPLRFANSKNVAARLKRFNGVSAAPLYHPPFMAEHFHHLEPESYIFVPSRLEEAKRQALLIRAMAHVRSRVIAVIAGEGGQKEALEQLVQELHLEHVVRFIGRVTDEEKIGLYARALAVFFGPYDEDYGYVTLEAMLSSKPVITCDDSGGPLEFVMPGQTGVVTAPEPKEIAAAIDSLNQNRQHAIALGHEARKRYDELNISWTGVVEKLMQA